MDRCVGGREAAWSMLSPPGHLTWQDIGGAKSQLLIQEALLAERSCWPEVPRLAQATGFVRWHSSNFHADCQVRFFTTHFLAWKCGRSDHMVPEPGGLQPPHHRGHPAHPQVSWAVRSGHRPKTEPCLTGPRCWDRFLSSAPTGIRFMARFI